MMARAPACWSSARPKAEGFIREFGLRVLEPASAHFAPKFRHTFTHFHLDIEPVYVEVAEPSQRGRERDDVRWYSPGSNEPLGLSAPAVKLIASLSEFSLT